MACTYLVSGGSEENKNFHASDALKASKEVTHLSKRASSRGVGDPPGRAHGLESLKWVNQVPDPSQQHPLAFEFEEGLKRLAELSKFSVLQRPCIFLFQENLQVWNS